MELSIDSFDRICRACLCESTKMKSLFTKLENNEQKFLDLFSLAANLSARTDDGLPKQVCGDCEMVIYKAEEFRSRCLNSETLLKKVLESSTQGQYFGTNPSETYNNAVESKLYLDKLCDFEMVVDKKDIVDSFGPENSQQLDASMLEHIVKKEVYENDNLGNDFEDNELSQPTEFKEETQTEQNALNFSRYKKKQCKNKLQKKSPKTKSFIPSDFSCNYCKTNFEDITTWQSHLDTHPVKARDTAKKPKDERIYQCSLCLRRCKTNKTLTKHMKLHERTDNIRFSCDKCKREFKYKSFLESHVRSVHMHDEYTCHLCTEKFTTKLSLEAHIDSHKEKKKHICDICNKAFIMLCTLKDHMRKHTGEKPFLCCTCGKGGAHPFTCDDCGNGFTTSSALVKHRRTHTGERPYACDLCTMRFAASGTLKNHRRTHTGERPFQCSLCEKAFVQRTDLISHIRCHTVSVGRPLERQRR
ncbi:putative KRAB box and zinc finger C2H2 type domain containing protein [Operophtera brumata]|uniref:Putative KRAB box and zinc finger C2H2 type domain containing protein n=1 Tax=Operophtera brumata TaxID=104452 RepID=A0A0L7L9R5_OPEBR|nr:putative KRAB box and zinc finger C2H2 type domain containing protein [Operophtera brumata]